jgi:hypothetical protein
MTTIEIKEDVKAKLLEYKTTKNESYNEILREILDMNEPEKQEPHFYEGVINIDGLNNIGMEHITDLVINHPGYDGRVSDYFVIRGIKARVEVEQPIIISVKAKTHKEVEDKMDTIINGIDPALIKCTFNGIMQLDTETGKRLDDKKVNMDAF